MTRVKDGMRQRARRPKTSTGCKTCRQRRIKCDEARPFCMKCLCSKRACEGYIDQGPVSRPSSSPQGTVPSSQLVVICTTSSPAEQRAFRYFQEQTVPQLCCYHNSELWSSAILQAAEKVPCIRHAVIALSSFHEIFSLRTNDRSATNSFALQHYNAAIRHQIQDATSEVPHSEDIDQYMTASILFVCIELLQDHYVSAFSLLANAIKLITASRSHGKQKHSAWPVEVIETTFNRLQLQAFGLLGPSVAADMAIPGVSRPCYPAIPKTFASIAEARCCLEALIGVFTFAQSRDEKDVLLRCADLVEGARMMANAWSSAFQNMLDQLGNNVSKQDEQGIRVLRIWQLRAIGTLEAAVLSSQQCDTKQVWDALSELGTKIIAIAEDVVANADLSPRTFTLDHGIVEPIMATALMCRDPPLRQRALDVLRQCHSREGLYDSVLSTCVVERATEIEAAAAPHARQASDIPTWARMDSILPPFQFGDRHAVFQLTRKQQGVFGGPIEVFEEIVSW